MNRKRLGLLLFGLATLQVASSCKKDEEQCLAGSGGGASLVLYPQHHGDPIIGIPGYVDSAFIKFNASDFPGDDPSKYDIVIAGEVGSNNIRVNGLKCGKYYIFMTGKDTNLVVVDQQRVKGGIPFTIEEGFSDTKSVIVPVTED
jgi:hypothetical protein